MIKLFQKIMNFVISRKSPDESVVIANEQDYHGDKNALDESIAKNIRRVWILYIVLSDPRGRPTLFSHVVSVHPSVHTFQNLVKTKQIQVKILIATGGTVGLAEGIIDDIKGFSLYCICKLTL